MELEFLRDEIQVDTTVDGFTQDGALRVKNDTQDYQIGKVLKIGRKVKDIKVGDRIAFLSRALNKIDLGGNTTYFLFEEHAVAKVK